MSKRLKYFVFNLLGVALSLAAAIIVLEYAVRVIYPAYDPSGRIAFVAGENERPNLGPRNADMRQVKNTGDFNVSIRFNEHGFRDDRNVADATAEDILAVGDSLSFGWGVEEQERVTEQLEALTGRRLFNISIPGNIDMSEKLVRYAMAAGAEAKTIFLFFSTESRTQNYDKIVQNPSAEIPTSLLSVKNFLMGHSGLYFLLTSAIHQTPSLRNAAIDMGLIIPSREGIPIRTFDAETIESTARRLKKFERDFGENVVAMILPSRGLWLERAQQVEEKIYRELIKKLDTYDVRYIDVRPAFEATGNPMQYYFQNDGHWTAEGHALVATYISSHLSDVLQK